VKLICCILVHFARKKKPKLKRRLKPEVRRRRRSQPLPSILCANPA
jgi:hypothetical protein